MECLWKPYISSFIDELVQPCFLLSVIELYDLKLSVRILKLSRASLNLTMIPQCMHPMQSSN